MLNERLFQLKYFLGWIPSAFVMASLLNGGARVEAFAMTFALCALGLVSLGVITLVTKIRGNSPVNWEIVWWCYPAVFFLNFCWQLMRMAFR